ncbi:MAG: hypothetical protein IT342_04960 [Candidatus Melainabacteria bacterium]|nr:hypothetical protein [Candidatus Melainabacteria bacterium]
MAPFDNGEQPSPSSVGRQDAHNLALNGAALLFEAPLSRSAKAAQGGVIPAKTGSPLFEQGSHSSFRDAIRSRVQGTPTGAYQAGEVANPSLDEPVGQPVVQQGDFPQRYPTVKDRVPTPVSNLPGLKFAPPTKTELSIIESTLSKKTNLDAPYTSKTTDQANTLFESLARIGSSAYFINRDYAKRTAAVEAKIASTPLVTSGTVQHFQVARDGLLNSLKVPIQNAEVGMEALYKSYPLDLFQGTSIAKLNGSGKIMMPHPWDFEKLTAADQVVAERYLRLTSLKEQLVAHWPPVASTQLGHLPVNVQGMPIVQAENLVAEAARFDAAGSKFTGEVTKVLANNNALRAANTNLVFKSVGTLAGAWVTNTAADVLINTKHGPSKVTWAADLISPAVLFTNKTMLTKFGVVTGAHVLAKLYDKWTEEE